MSDKKDGAPPPFRVTAEDCERWQARFQRMAKALEAKDTADKEDGVKMFYTASVLMQELAQEIKQDSMLSDIPNPFGNTMGEA